jgi:hypothetical protein
VPLVCNRRTSKGCLGVALRATQGTAIISLILRLIIGFIKGNKLKKAKIEFYSYIRRRVRNN